MYLADYHVHSTCSQDGRQTMAQAAQAAVAAGMDELCLTDHVDTIYWGPEQKPRWDFDWDAVRRFKARALNSEHPTVRNTVQNPDTFFQHREACNGAYDRLPAIVEEYMKAVSDLTGRDYQLFNY